MHVERVDAVPELQLGQARVQAELARTRHQRNQRMQYPALICKPSFGEEGRPLYCCSRQVFEYDRE